MPMQSQALKLNIKQKQALALTPQLLQSIHVLGLTCDELKSYIAAELESNPALEASWGSENDVCVDAPNWSDFEREKLFSGERLPEDANDEDINWAEYLKEKNYYENKYGNGAPADILLDSSDLGQGLADHLLEQLTADDLARISEDAARAYGIVAWIAEALDGNGFLPHGDIDLLAVDGIEKDEVMSAIAVMQGLEPAGIAAGSVRESLMLQYERGGGADPMVIGIIKDHLPDVAMHSVSAVSKALGIKRHDVEQRFEIIASLDPRPGMGFQRGEKTHYVFPDVVIDKAENGFEIRVNEAHIPTLTVSPYYRKILARAEKGSEEYIFLAERISAAVALIKNLKQRGETIYNVMAAILKKQETFLENGYAHLKPMTQKQVADAIRVHESTVSRTVHGKYVQTPHGIIEIKQLFGGGVRTGDGEGITPVNVKARLLQLTDAEDKKRPLSDKVIADVLRQEGIFLSRRTVAKYRYEAGIAPSSRRAGY